LQIGVRDRRLARQFCRVGPTLPDGVDDFKTLRSVLRLHCLTNMQSEHWIAAVVETIDSHRRLIDGAVQQLSDEELARRPVDGMNSVATILRHLGGNLLSRWTDFLTTDGEKPSRNRDSEFEDWPGDRASLMEFFHRGWQTWRESIASLTANDLTKTVAIRGEPHSVPLAIHRSLTHTAYHVGQIMLISRLVHTGDWKWLTIRPSGSQEHNEQTWGTSASRGTSGGTRPH
jgi:hypothetical protein